MDCRKDVIVMRRLIALILTVLLLCGCAASPIPGGEKTGLWGDLWHLPIESAEDLSLTQLCDAGDALLLCGRSGSGLTLLRISQEDLTTAASATLDAGPRAYVQVLDDCISVADPESGTVTLLTPSLEPLTVLELYCPADAWFLSPDAGTLYAVSGNALLSRPLATGELQTFPDRRRYSLLASTQPRTILDGLRLSLMYMTPDRAILACAGAGSDLVTRWYALDLRTGIVGELEDSEKLAMGKGLLPLADGNWLDRDARDLTLYGSNGSFLARCSLPDSDNGYCGRDLIYSAQRQGWFFIDYPDGSGTLMFWDPVEGGKGTDVDLAPESVPEGSVLPRELYDRAAELSARFSVDIRIADRCIRDYDSFNSSVLTDPEVIAAALDELEAALALYPENFFAQIGFADVEIIRIEIAADLRSKSDPNDSAGTSGFAQQRDGYYLLVLNGQRIRRAVIFHELSHVIDKRLDWDAKLRDDALYSEEGWMALQPEGFEYAGSHQNVPDSVKAYYDSGYFVRDYSCVSASEDRAMLMEKAMLGETAVFEENPYLLPKLEYYSACIRDSFDTALWPEMLPWEQMLN